MVDFIVNDVLFWICWGSLSLLAFNIVFHKGIPNIRSAPAIRKKVISILQENMADRDGGEFTLLDLGSGNGLFTREIARAFPKAKVIGIESTWHTALLACWLKRLNKLDNLDYVHSNFFDYDFSKADAVVLYLMPHLMRPLGEKLQKEGKSGLLVASNKFKLGAGWEPVTSHRVKTLYFHQGELHVYRKA